LRVEVSTSLDDQAFNLVERRDELIRERLMEQGPELFGRL
jgi:hypothetical protein